MEIRPGHRPVARRSTLPWLLSALVLLAGAAAPLTPGVAQDAEAVRRTDRAAKLIREKRLGEALAELERAIQADSEYWEAHYQRGRALGLQGDMEAALRSLLRATELNPGMAHAHELAAIAAWQTGDHPLAWDQIIDAYLAGGKVEARVRAMAQSEPPPPDLVERMNAPRVFVAPLDVKEIKSRAELPFNRNPMVREDTSRSGVPADIQGPDRLREARAELPRVRRQFQLSLQDSPLYGVVPKPAQSEYVLKIAVDELGETLPRQMSGYLELIATRTGELGYRRNFELRRIDAAGDLRGQIELIVDDMETWLRKLRGDS